MNESSPRQQTRDFIAQHLSTAEFDDDEDLFASGRVNSLLAMRLVLFVEQRLGIMVTGADLELDNFRSVDAIVRFVERKRTVAAGVGAA